MSTKAPAAGTCTRNGGVRRREGLPGEWRVARMPSAVTTFDNGLTVIAHRDPKAPIVAVHVAYHAGSRDEPRMRSGLAHLCEHLMFAGTARFPGNLFAHLERLGATSINAVSREDHTACFEAVPREKLDTALEIEAARMGASSATFGSSEFDRQREVVRNELLQREGDAFGPANRLIAQNTYSHQHPYWHPADGLIQDLDNLALADAADWFEKRYCPANATLVIAGDVEPEDAIARARRYFASIRPGGGAADRQPAIAKLAAGHRLTQTGAAANRIYLVWNVPQFDAPEHAGLALLVAILAGGINSRLSRQMIHAARRASAIGGELRARELGSQIVLWATASATTDCAGLERGLRAELHQLREAGPTDLEVLAARAHLFAGLIRSSERVCGPHGKADRLATAAILAGDVHADERRFARIGSIRPEELGTLARTWLDDAAFVLEFRAANASAQCSLTEPRSRSLPRTESPHTRRVRHVRIESRAAPPIIAISLSGSSLYEFRLIAEGGCAADPASKSGLAGVAMAAITAGDPDQRRGGAAQFDRIGAQIEARVPPDASILAMSALASKTPQALKLFAAMVCDPQIGEARLNRAIAARSALIRHEQSHPIDLARRILPPLVFARSHPYARPLSGSGTLPGVTSVLLEDVHRFHSSWRSRGVTTLVVCGPSPEPELRAFAEKALAGLVATESPPTPDRAPRASDRCAGRIVLLDQPNRSQTAIFAALPAPPRSAPAADALLVADTILGGAFTSRLNLKLREGKGWSYGARTALLNARHAGLWLAHTFVQPANTIAAMRAVEGELRAPLDGALVTSGELTAATAYLTLRLPAELETNRQVADAIADRVVCRLPPTYHEELPRRLLALRPAEVTSAWREVVSRHPITWLIVGEAASLAARIEAEGLGVLEVIASPEEIP